MKMRAIFLGVFFCAILFSEAMAVAIPAIPKDTEKFGVLIESSQPLIPGTTEQSFVPGGTGFLFSGHEWVYLITAKHVFFGSSATNIQSTVFRFHTYVSANDQEVHEIFEIDVKKILEAKGLLVGTRDLIAVKIFNSLKDKTVYSRGVRRIASTPSVAELVRYHLPSLNDYLPYDQVDIAGDVIYFGFPLSLKRLNDIYGTKEPLQFDINKPLFRKGIIAGKNDKLRTIIIDGTVHHGNSGGPVLRVYPSGQAKIIGIITQLIPDAEISVKEGTNLYTNISWQNSGYSVVEPIDVVIEMIEKIEKR